MVAGMLFQSSEAAVLKVLPPSIIKHRLFGGNNTKLLDGYFAQVDTVNE